MATLKIKFVALYYRMIERLLLSEILSEIRFQEVFREMDYINQNPDVDEKTITPILHYLLYGRFQKRNPGFWFHECFFIEQNGKARKGIFTITPWIFRRNKTFYRRSPDETRELIRMKQPDKKILVKRLIEPETIADHYRSPENNTGYEKEREKFTGHFSLKLIAFYKFPDNKFQESNKNCKSWQQIAKAVPQFPGHFQPRLPGELGYYNPETRGVYSRQAELAKEAGISGFCFDAVETGFNFIQKNDMPFSFCFRINQAKLNLLSDNGLYERLKSFFGKQNYLIFNEKPVLVVSDSEKIQIQLYKTGVRDIFLINENPLPSWIAQNSINDVNYHNPQFPGKVIEYEKFADVMIKKQISENQIFNSIIPGWDETAIHRDPFILHQATPQLYQQWLTSLGKWIIEQQPENQQLLLISSWNDWKNGCYLEPDRRWGYGFLNATARAMTSIHEKN